MEQSLVTQHGPYVAAALLGEGGMARVLLARHRGTGQLVALKVAKDGEVAAGALRREVRLLSTLHHSALPALVAADGSASPPWLATEWVEGQHTLRWRLTTSWSSGARGAHWEEARRLLVEVCGALAYLHAQGIAHRDVTPENILLGPGGSALLADLGLARAFDAGGKEPLEVAGVVEGAPGYMAPEQICGDRVDGRADLYALGCVLNEVVCGQPIFKGSAPELLRQHLHESPRRLGERVPGISAKLERVVLRCLEKDPRGRPSAEEVAEALGDPAPRRTLFPRPMLVGRSEVLAAGARSLDSAKVGHASLLLLSGEPGAGKTRCLSELAEVASRSGFRVIASGSQPRSERATLQSAPLDALRPVMEAMLSAPVLLSPDDVEILRRYFQPAALAGVVQERWQVDAALQRGLAGLSRARPVLLILDDLQWADEASIATLAALGEERRAVGPVAMIAACRAYEGAACRERLRSAGWPVHPLAGLSHGEVQALAQEMLSGRAVPPELMSILERQAGGNPFFVSEYVRMAVAERVLSRDSTGLWRVAGGANAALQLPVPGSLRELLRRAMERLSPRAYAAAEVASVAGRVVDEVLVARLSDLPEEAMQPALRELRDGGVLEELEEGELRFRHDVFREVVAARLPDERRRTLHRGCALELESRGAGADPHVAGTMANHWEAAGELLRACDYLEQAGRHALGLGACADAIAAFRRALEIGAGADRDRRARWMLWLGESYQGQTDHEQARAHLRRALEAWGVRVPRSRLGWLALLVASVFSQVALRRWRSGRSLQPEVPRAAGRLAETSFFGQRWLEFAACTVWSVNLAERSGGCAPARQYGQLGLLAGLARAHRTAQRYFDRAATTGEGPGAALVFEAMYRGVMGDLATSASLLDQSISGLRATGQSHDLPNLLLMRAAADYLDGNYGAALDRLRTLRREKQGGSEHVRLWTSSAEAGCLVALGRHAEAVVPLEEALALARASSDQAGQFLLSGQLALAALLCGHRERARMLAEDALTLSRERPYSLYGVLGGYRGASIVFLAEWEREGRATAALRELAQRSVHLLMACLRRYPVGAAGALWCAGLLEWLSGNRRKAVRTWRKGLKKCGGVSMKREEALLHAELARTGADPDDLSHEGRASRILLELGATGHLAALQAARRAWSA